MTSDVLCVVSNQFFLVFSLQPLSSLVITEIRVTVVGSVDHASYSVIALNDIYLIVGEAVGRSYLCYARLYHINYF